MAYYLAFDGGGSKLNGVMFDGDMNILGLCRAGGISTSQGSLEDCRSNIESGLDQLFSAHKPARVDKMYLTGVGHFELLESGAKARAELGETVHMSEAEGGLIAGALKKYGILALSGTGSDIFYIAPDGTRDVVGAWGPILGDDGSGVWIGQQAIRAIVRLVNGWGEDTVMLPLIREEWHLKADWDMVEIVHRRSTAPLRTVGSLTPMVGRAAAMGDKVALGILREAGHLMAVQTDTLIRRHGFGPDELDVTLCGGAWKSHPIMLDTYRSELQAKYPTLTAERPLFEHVMCGPARLLLDAGVPREQAIATLKAKFPMYTIQNPDTQANAQ